jgi:hypothetical protein
MLDVVCEHCGTILRIPEKYLGQKGKCNHCQGEITVMAEPPKFSGTTIDVQQEKTESTASHARVNVGKPQAALLAEAEAIRRRLQAVTSLAERKQLQHRYEQIAHELRGGAPAEEQLPFFTATNEHPQGSTEKAVPNVSVPTPGNVDVLGSKSISLSRIVGVSLIIIGLCTCAYFMFVFDVSVPVDTPSFSIGGQTFGGEHSRVVNIGLMNDQRNGITAGGALAVIGAIFFALGELKKDKKRGDTTAAPDVLALEQQKGLTRKVVLIGISVGIGLSCLFILLVGIIAVNYPSTRPAPSNRPTQAPVTQSPPQRPTQAPVTQSPPPNRITDPPISEAQFQQIKQGMTRDQVVQILGRPGTLTHQSHSMIGGSPYNLDTYEWKWNGGGFMPSSITVSFTNGYVDHTNYRN